MWLNQLQGEFLSEVAVTLEILEAPQVARLYFWALQVCFVDDRRISGAGHLGLQWHPDYPASTAVNWGGYADDWAGGGELDGSEAELPSALSNPNTRDFVWRPNTPYRFRIAQPPGSEGGAWRGQVTDIAADTTVTVRDLFARGSLCGRPVVWSEVFADCDAPPVSVRWSNFVVRTATDRLLAPSSVRVTHQAPSAGGCTNTNSFCDSVGVVQRTNSKRANANGSHLKLPVLAR